MILVKCNMMVIKGQDLVILVVWVVWEELILMTSLECSWEEEWEEWAVWAVWEAEVVKDLPSDLVEFINECLYIIFIYIQ
jgi:hypothetical protein